MIYQKDEIDVAIKVVIDELCLVAESDRILSQGKTCVSLTPIQIFNHTRTMSPLHRSIAEILIRHAHQSEILAPGSFTRALTLTRESLLDPRWRIYGKRTQTSQATARRASRVDVLRVIENLVKDQLIKKIVIEILKLAGLTARVIIEKTQSSTLSIERVSSTAFPFLPLIDLGSKVNYHNKPKILIVDGFVERVSEIHHLLYALSESKEVLFFFARGFDPEVTNTLAVNFKRQTLNVIPILVPFDVEGINALVDIAVVVGCDVFSSLKGETMTSVKVEELPSVDAITITKKGIVIDNSSSRSTVKAHVERLRLKLAEVPSKEQEELLNARIQNVSNDHVVVRLPDDGEYVIRAQQLDVALRALTSVNKHGVNEKGEPIAMSKIPTELSERCLMQLAQIETIITS